MSHDHLPQEPKESERDSCVWHASPLPFIFNLLQSQAAGLSKKESDHRLMTLGPNRLPQKKPISKWTIFFRQFQSPLIYILGLAAVVSLVIGEMADAGFIAAVLILNAVIGGVQEWRAEKSAQSLQKLLQIRATVERSGLINEIDAEDLVPGDIVWVESGNRTPADVRLLMDHGLQVDESLLTGESLPVSKDAHWLGTASTPLAERKNMLYAGSMVARGRGKGIVVSTATKTVVGELALEVLGRTEGEPPLILRIKKFSRVIAMWTMILVSLVALIGIFVRGTSVMHMFMFSVALAVSAIPEGLPVALTIALAIGTSRMAKRGVIVRRLAAVEGLGSCTMIASDKTGTLTCNELTVKEIQLLGEQPFQVTGEGFLPEGKIVWKNNPLGSDYPEKLKDLMRISVLCNEADLHPVDGSWLWRGDPTDVALLTLAQKFGWNRERTLEDYPQINQIPFEPERKFSASFHQHKNKTWVFVKGAPERIFSLCKDKINQETHDQVIHLAKKGYRVLALAQGLLPEELGPSKAPDEPNNLEFIGFVGMMDPLRPGVKQAVKACGRAGVRVSMVTGDHPATALAIAHDLGLAITEDQVMTGTDLEEKTAQEIQDIIKNSQVFARITPGQKLQLVEAMRTAGHFVAVTGDGVNDAPALKAANIGVAMGKSGTDVAREASELVISDDNFATIVAGIEEGRIAYNNIRNVIFLLISTGAAEVVLVTLAVSFGTPLPLLPVQLLWLNLVTNGIQDVALAFEPGAGDELFAPPRPPQEPIFNKLMLERTILSALFMGSVAFLVFNTLLKWGWTEQSARNTVLLLMVFFENIHVGNCRSEIKSAFALAPWRSPILLIGVVSALVLHMAMLYLPWGQRLLGTEPVSLTLALILFAISLTILIPTEIHKIFQPGRKKHASN